MEYLIVVLLDGTDWGLFEELGGIGQPPVTTREKEEAWENSDVEVAQSNADSIKLIDGVTDAYVIPAESYSGHPSSPPPPPF